MRMEARRNEHDLHRPSHEAIVVGRRDVESLVEGHMRREGGDDGARGGGEIRGRKDLDAVLGRIRTVGALLLQERAGVAVVAELGIADEKRRGRKRKVSKEELDDEIKESQLSGWPHQETHLPPTLPLALYPTAGLLPLTSTSPLGSKTATL